jgi:phytanoyl-CoA hydroxylase
MISQQQREDWDRNGHFLIRGFSSPEVCQKMLDRVIEISRDSGEEIAFDGRFVMPEQNLAASVAAGAPREQRTSKIFKLHRDSAFRSFLESEPILEIGRSLLSERIDCFLSQFIFKNPGAWGQPWHQDSHYFPFDRGPQVGLWLAITEATLDNGCLWILPGSHREPVHEHVADRRPNANIGYTEIVDCDFSRQQSVTMSPGDLLVFHSHLMHCSRDNESEDLRAAMVFHLAEHGTRDRSTTPTPVNDWMCLPDRQD